GIRHILQKCQHLSVSTRIRGCSVTSLHRSRAAAPSARTPATASRPRRTRGSRRTPARLRYDDLPWSPGDRRRTSAGCAPRSFFTAGRGPWALGRGATAGCPPPITRRSIPTCPPPASCHPPPVARSCNGPGPGPGAQGPRAGAPRTGALHAPPTLRDPYALRPPPLTHRTSLALATTPAP